LDSASWSKINKTYLLEIKAGVLEIKAGVLENKAGVFNERQDSTTFAPSN
jgi:hypothetical protein